jgi:hypothetical protein
MGALVTQRWRRYGKDRLYVSSATGEKVGWLDLLTGERHLEPGADGDAFERAAAAWSAEAQEEPPATAPPATSPAAPPVAPPVSPPPIPAAEQAVTVLPASAPASREPAPQPTDAAMEAEAVPLAPPSADLATHRAGAGPREQALMHQQAAPVRTFLARVLGVHTDERAWRVGAVGEEKVGAQLAKLPPTWQSLHGIPVGERGSDIDHVVIGPGGVYTLNAKRHPGAKIWVSGRTFMVNGHKHPYLRNSEFEAARASRLLTAACGFPVVATGVIVPVDADDIVIKTAPEAVHLVNRRRLVRWLRDRPQLLNPETVAAIFAAARLLDTWQPPSRA